MILWGWLQEKIKVSSQVREEMRGWRIINTRHCDTGKCFKTVMKWDCFFTQTRCNGYLCHQPWLHIAEASTPAMLSGQLMQTHLWKAYVIRTYRCGGVSKTHCLRGISLPTSRSGQNTRRKKNKGLARPKCVYGGWGGCEPKPNNQGTWALI